MLYLVFPSWPFGGEMEDDTSDGVKFPGWPRSSI